MDPDLHTLFAEALPDWRIERQPESALTILTSPNGVSTRIAFKFLHAIGANAEHINAITDALKLAAIEQHDCEVTIEVSVERTLHELPWWPPHDPRNPLVRQSQGEIITATYRVE